MEYKILCVKCKRPAEIDDKKSKDGYKVYKSKCNCGGAIKPMID
ncbi:hypothetical protein SFC08_14600 [Lysinibacillus halotolerans]|nr:hypothetical protein [Ureibacillus galli]